MKIVKKQVFGISFTLGGLILCIGAVFVENLLVIPGFIFFVAGLLIWNPGGLMENIYPPLFK